MERRGLTLYDAEAFYHQSVAALLLGNCHQELHLASAMRTCAIRIGSHTGTASSSQTVNQNTIKHENGLQLSCPWLSGFFPSSSLMKCSAIINFGLNHGGCRHGNFSRNFSLGSPPTPTLHPLGFLQPSCGNWMR